MPTQRRAKQDHLIHADVVDSKAKSGVWFGKRDAFQARQRQILEAVKDRLDLVSLENAILTISVEPPGITVIAKSIPTWNDRPCRRWFAGSYGGLAGSPRGLHPQGDGRVRHL